MKNVSIQEIYSYFKFSGPTPVHSRLDGPPPPATADFSDRNLSFPSWGKTRLTQSANTFLERYERRERRFIFRSPKVRRGSGAMLHTGRNALRASHSARTRRPGGVMFPGSTVWRWSSVSVLRRRFGDLLDTTGCLEFVDQLLDRESAFFLHILIAQAGDILARDRGWFFAVR